MHLADYLKRRKDRRRELVQGKKPCNICGQNFDEEKELEKHTKKEHSDVV